MSFILSAVFSFIALKSSPIPYVLVFLCWSVYFFYQFYRCKNYRVKAIWSNLAFTLLLFGVIEIYSWRSPGQKEEDTRYDIQYTNGRNTHNDILGYAPKSGNTIVSKKFKAEKLLYAVTYTIDDDGLRITPKFDFSSFKQCAVFFGGSFTFGEGLNDKETMPYLVGEKSKINTYNFAFYGYGPHQMLSALEQGMVESIVECEPKFAVYLVPRSHVLRSAGLSKWDKHGPNFILLPDGSVKQDGHFDDKSSIVKRAESATFVSRLKAQINKSFLFQKYIENRLPYSDEAINLFLAIVDASKNEFTGRYPGSEFHVIYWDYDPNHRDTIKILEGLSVKRIKYHLISRIIPDFISQQSKYEISALDLHPNALAQEIIAQYVVDNILNEDRSKERSLDLQGPE